jgi:predicted DNA-binding transcriptional regulator YafY
MVKIEKKINQLERLHELIQRKATGTPAELAAKMDISARSIYHLIEYLKSIGASIKYSKYKETYYYAEDFVFPYKKDK